MVDVRTFDPSPRAAPRRKTPTFPPPQPESASAGAPLGTQLNAGTFLGPSSAVVPPSEPARQPLPMSTIRLGVLGGVGFASVVLLGVFIVSQATTAPATTAATTSALTVTAAPTDSPSAKSAATEAAPNGTEEVGPDVPKPVASAPRPGPAAPTKPEPAAKPPTPVSPAADPGEFNRGAAAASLGGAAGGAKSCKTADGPKGSGRVKVTFNPTSGNVTSAIVEGQQFEGTSVGACVAAAFRGAHIPPFDGAPVAVSKSFTID